MARAWPLPAADRDTGPITIAGAWRTALIRLGIAAAAILALFARDAADMARIWWSSSTYNHILLIPPILAWLVAQRREALGRIAPAPWWGGAPVLAAAACGWIIGEAAGLAVARHLALILFLEGAVLTLLGHRVARALAFPLGFAIFLLPVGDELVPALQMLTAEMAMALLGWADIPAHLSGVFISTPTGYFEVAEACSGVKFLIAMLALGVLVANVCFVSWPRRIAFVAAAAALPILANGVRAFGTIYVAHYRGTEFAAGFDHIVYGWIFFALVVAALLGGAWRWFDRAATDPAIDPALVERLAIASPPAPVPRWPLVAIAAAVILPQLWSALGPPPPAPLPQQIVVPAVPGWTPVADRPAHPWMARADGADRWAMLRYARGDARIDLFVALYSGQSEGREIAGYGQGAVDPNGDWAWAAPAAPLAGARADRLAAPGPVTREAVTVMRIGDVGTGSALVVKRETLIARLLRQPRPAMLLIVSAEDAEGRPARAAIEAFLAAAGGTDTLGDAVLKPR